MQPPQQTTHEIFLENLLRLRKKQKHTQDSLSKASGISRSYIAEMEQNRHSPGFSIIDKLAPALGVQAWQLLKKHKR